MINNKGITLIALVITIIVMLILVGVSVTVALNGGLFQRAGEARDRTNAELVKENKLDEGKVLIDNVEHDISEYYPASTSAAEEP